MNKTIYPLHLSYCLYVQVATQATKNDENSSNAVYVKPSIDYRGRYRKGYVRFKTNTKKDAFKSQARSRYYYHSKGKYMRH
jgi:hypothetical protein